jgi:hypothetical protein
VEGFEPPHGGTKNRCLTAWRHPITEFPRFSKDIIVKITQIICNNKNWSLDKIRRRRQPRGRLRQRILFKYVQKESKAGNTFARTQKFNRMILRSQRRKGT